MLAFPTLDLVVISLHFFKKIVFKQKGEMKSLLLMLVYIHTLGACFKARILTKSLKGRAKKGGYGFPF